MTNPTIPVKTANPGLIHASNWDQQEYDMNFLRAHLPADPFGHFRQPDDYLLVYNGDRSATLRDTGKLSVTEGCSNFWIMPKNHVETFTSQLHHAFQSQMCNDEANPEDSTGVLIAAWGGDGDYALVASFSTLEYGLSIESHPELAQDNTQRQVAYDDRDSGIGSIWENAAIDAVSDPTFPLLELALLLKNAVDRKSLCNYLNFWGRMDTGTSVEVDEQDPWLTFRYLMDPTKNKGQGEGIPEATLLLQSIISGENLTTELASLKDKKSASKPKKI